MSDSCHNLTPTASDSLPLWLADGGFVLLFYSVLCMFWGIVFVCEEFGVPSITAFCKRHHISDAIAGSIFIGTGLSLPVFFISLIGMFLDNASIGIGAVVGGNLFNHLFTMGSSVHVSPTEELPLNRWIYLRESLFYLMSCVAVLWSMKGDAFLQDFSSAFDSRQWQSCITITWFRSLILVVLYVVYCFVDINFESMEGFVRACLSTGTTNEEPDSAKIKCAGHRSKENGSTLVENISKKDDIEGNFSETIAITFTDDFPGNDADEKNILDDSNDKVDEFVENVKVELAVAKSMLDSAFDENDHYKEMFVMPKGSLFWQSLFILTFPLRCLIYLSVPDVRRPGSEERIYVSICMTIVWLAVLSYVLTVSLTILGTWWKINGTLMGFTIAAWASNFPAHWSSIVVSKHGFGDVSCCNCLGSNIFNNFIGLGLSWLIYSMWKQGAPYSGLEDNGLYISVLLMMAVIPILTSMLVFSNWSLRKWMMPTLIGLYFLFVGFLCVFALVLDPVS